MVVAIDDILVFVDVVNSMAFIYCMANDDDDMVCLEDILKNVVNYVSCFDNMAIDIVINLVIN